VGDYIGDKNMDINTILIPVALITLIYSSYIDIKTLEVEDYITIGLIIFGLTTRTVFSVAASDFSFLLHGLLGFGICLVIGYLLFVTGFWGGGDAKLLMGIGAVIGANFTLLKYLVLQELAGAVFCFFYVLYFISKDFSRYKISFSKVFASKQGTQYRLSYALLLGMLIAGNLWIKGIIIFIAIVFLLYIATKSAENTFFIKNVKPKELVEGDWLTKDIFHNGKLLCKRTAEGISKKDINRLSIKRYVEIRQGIPFVPAMLIAFIMILI
jgi:Flp pilus assembly protein protease CpaA